jgi:hypothetical protein
MIHLRQVQVQSQLLCVHVESAAAAGPGLDVVQDVAFLHKTPTKQSIVTGVNLPFQYSRYKKNPSWLHIHAHPFRVDGA